jgi:phosphatidylserine decarboxylase
VERRSLGKGIPVAKGEQIGIFDMGSTVVVCFAPGAVRLRDFASGDPVRMGESIAATRER